MNIPETVALADAIDSVVDALNAINSDSHTHREVIDCMTGTVMSEEDAGELIRFFDVNVEEE